jgi:hypothetical protein
MEAAAPDRLTVDRWKANLSIPATPAGILSYVSYRAPEFAEGIRAAPAEQATRTEGWR